jgi:hypothetical protein
VIALLVPDRLTTTLDIQDAQSTHGERYAFLLNECHTVIVWPAVDELSGHRRSEVL